MLAALPTTYDLTDPTQNLAGCGCGGPPLADVGFAGPTAYQAWDGEPIGYGNTCGPLSGCGPALDGLNIVPPDLASPQYWWGAAVGALAVWFLSRRDQRRYAQDW
jgi:hypothetical protein